MNKFAITLLLACSAICSADTMIKTHTVITDSDAAPDAQNRSEHRAVHYRRGSMRRRETIDNRGTTHLSRIANCDTRTGFMVDDGTSEYEPYKVVKFWTTSQLNDYRQKNPHDLVQLESKTVDTGERKTFFGHSARHLITTTRRAADKTNSGGEETIDGWYIEHEKPDENCAPDYVRSEPYYVIATALVVFPQIAEVHHTGPLPTGLAVKLTMIHKSADGRCGPERTTTAEETVEELSGAPLSPSLFDLPSGFHKKP